MKIFTILGARPQFIKAATVSRAFLAHKDVSEILLHTGQHFDAKMSEVFFSDLDIPNPKYNLGIGGGAHGAMTGAQLVGIEEALIHERPDRVIVYGDTNSTLSGALGASKLNIPTAHVEAGLRSFNRLMPEEINRVVADHVCDTLFAPTETAMQNLGKEGIATNKCHLVGDVMYDAALFFGERAKQSSDILTRLGMNNRDFVLTTIHRAENTDDLSRLRIILSTLEKVSKHVPVIWPLHPRTRRFIVENDLQGYLGANILVIEPVGYLDMVMLEKNASVIATDSGGVQKEAFFYRVPCVTVRDETEWVELVDAEWNTVVPPTDDEELARFILKAIGRRGKNISPYGDGKASEEIVRLLLE